MPVPTDDESDPCQVSQSTYANFTRKGNTLYMHVHFWPGEYVAISGLGTGVKSARILKTGQRLKFTQNSSQTRFPGLPQDAPDAPVTTLAIECESEPPQNTIFARKEMPPEGV